MRERRRSRADRRSRAALFAGAFAGLSFVMLGGIVLLWSLARSSPVYGSWGVNLSVGSLFSGGLFMVFPLVGALIVSRSPRNPVGWILIADGFLWMLTGAFDYYIIYGLASPGTVPFPLVVAGINNWLWIPAVGLIGTYLFLLFPNGSPPSVRWRPLVWVSGGVIAVLSLGVALSPGTLDRPDTLRNPFGIEAFPWLETATYIVLPLLPLCMVASVLSLVLRYRNSGGEERQQIKWIALAASVVGVSYVIAMLASFASPSGGWLAVGSPLWSDIAVYVALGSFTLVPASMGFAILKYRLYDIDFIINRTLVYGALTVSLAATYFVAVISLQRLLAPLAGEDSQLAVVASTLAVAALFNPLRRRIQLLIDRRFYRSRYDAREILDDFTKRLRDETDLEVLGENLERAVRETVQPDHVSLWLRGQKSAHGEISG